MNRRSFLIAGFWTIVGAIAGGLAYPILRYVTSPVFRRLEMKWLPIGRVKEFPVGEPALISLRPPWKEGWTEAGKMAVYVLNEGEGNFTVYSIHCTHMACPVQWNAAARKFFSPCHGGVFDIRGTVLSGPPPRPLDTMPVRVERDQVQIIYQAFQPGIPRKVVIT